MNETFKKIQQITIENMINKYYLVNKNNNECIMALPLKINENYCTKTKTGGPKLLGSKNNLSVDNLFDLEYEGVTQVYNNKKEQYEDFSLEYKIEDADAYEIRNRLSTYNSY